MQYYHPPRGAAPPPRTPLLEVALAPKIHQKRYARTHRQKGPSSGILLATPATKKEYSGELGSQNDSKMEPKMEPRQQWPTLTKHAPAWTDCMSTHPPWGAPFSLIFPRPEKDHQKVNIITPICEPGSKITPKVPLQGPKMEPKILQKASQNHL